MRRLSDGKGALGEEVDAKELYRLGKFPGDDFYRDIYLVILLPMTSLSSF